MSSTIILVNKINALLQEAWESSLASSTMWGHRENSAICNQEEESLHQYLTMLASWTSCFQNSEKINVCCLYATQSVRSCYSSPNRLRHLTLRSTCLFHAQFLDFYDENNGKKKRSGEKGKALVDRLYWSTWWRWVREKTFHNLEDIGKGILWGGEEFS